jgi:predicted RNA methylase
MKSDQIRRALRDRLSIADEDFDTIYPPRYRQVSGLFWTPVEAARRAADLLVKDGARRILDVGAGVGKFCLVGAATTARASFVGIEHRAHLIQVACDASRRLGIKRVTILHGRLDDIPTDDFDAFYFYNPFGENLLARAVWLDDCVPLSRERYTADVSRARAVLACARRGTRVVTYHGYGGSMPPSYDLVHAERCEYGALQLWVKNATTVVPAVRPNPVATPPRLNIGAADHRPDPHNATFDASRDAAHPL